MEKSAVRLAFNIGSKSSYVVIDEDTIIDGYKRSGTGYKNLYDFASNVFMSKDTIDIVTKEKRLRIPVSNILYIAYDGQTTEEDLINVFVV